MKKHAAHNRVHHRRFHLWRSMKFFIWHENVSVTGTPVSTSDIKGVKKDRSTQNLVSYLLIDNASNAINGTSSLLFRHA